MKHDVEVVPYGTGRSFYVRVDGKALRTKDGKGPRLFRSHEAAKKAGEDHASAMKPEGDLDRLRHEFEKLPVPRPRPSETDEEREGREEAEEREFAYRKDEGLLRR